MKIKLVDNDENEVVKNYDNMLELDDGTEWIVFESSEAAGKAARERWIDMQRNDKREFKCMIGEERLVQWACGESDSFGISSFEEFLDVTESVPQEEFASYDGNEFDVETADEELINELGFKPSVAYRHN
jgi:hypothetical protein